jgi:hypothetical protein
MGNRKSKQSDSINDILLMFLPKVLVDICASYLIIWSFQKQLRIKWCEHFFPMDDLLFFAKSEYKKSYGIKLVTNFMNGKTVGKVILSDKIYYTEYGDFAKWCLDGKTLFAIRRHESKNILKLVDYKLIEWSHVNLNIYNIRDVEAITMTRQSIMYIIIHDCMYKHNIYTNVTTKIFNFIDINILNQHYLVDDEGIYLPTQYSMISDDNNLYIFISPFKVIFNYLMTYDHKKEKIINIVKIDLDICIMNPVIINNKIYVCSLDKIYFINAQDGSAVDTDIEGDYIATDGTKLYVRDREKDIVSMYTHTI